MSEPLPVPRDERAVGGAKFFARRFEVILETAREALSEDDYVVFLHSAADYVAAFRAKETA